MVIEIGVGLLLSVAATFALAAAIGHGNEMVEGERAIRERVEAGLPPPTAITLSDSPGWGADIDMESERWGRG
jgi:L-alanine-DL-glutamate epimerase-like enolase superfamily enzyme